MGHYKPARDRLYSKKAEQKIDHVIDEFEEGKLHSGSKHGPKVNKLKQALAIGISEAKRRGYKAGEHWEKSRRNPDRKDKFAISGKIGRHR